MGHWKSIQIAIYASFVSARVRIPRTVHRCLHATYDDYLNRLVVCMLPPDLSYSQCLDAFTVALNQACEWEPGHDKSWYASTMELQLASLPFCKACRNVMTLGLKVKDETPARLLETADAPYPGSPRVPRLRARTVTWRRNSVVELGNPLFALAEVSQFCFLSDASIDDVSWPLRLRVLMLGGSFDQPLAKASLPPSLTELGFGHEFNQSIQGVVLPPLLQFLWFDGRFDHPISNVSWPESLEDLQLHFSFNQPVEGVVWPERLESISFGQFFNQPIAGVKWPTSLKTLRFDDEFGHPIADVKWPPGLEVLELGQAFNQPIARVAWPASLQEVAFGICTQDPVYLHSYFNQAIDEVIWPASLRKLALGGEFKQSLQDLGKLMPNLEVLTLVVKDYTILKGIKWPKGPMKLVVPIESVLDGVEIPQSVEVCHRLDFS